MRYGIVGDMHGDTKEFVGIINELGARKISHAFVVGDFGLWTHERDGHVFLDEINTAAKKNNLGIYAVGGNHENWDHWNWYVQNMPTHKGFAYVRSNVHLAPKAHKFTLGGTQFVVAGGAVSIDKAWRLQKERGIKDSFGNRIHHAKGPRTLWWPDEELTQADVVKIQKFGVKADVLLTHDCSNNTQFKSRLKPDVNSERHRRLIDDVLRAVRPDFHFHGHMHERYEWENSISHRYEHHTLTYGLECNGMWYNWGVLDTDLGEFAFRGKGMQFRSLSA